MLKETLISIIVPVYNAEQYLEECLKSLVQQTYTNIEIICVNDGSDDQSSNIIKRYMKSDDRIKIIEQDNCGVSATRNNGIKYSTGEYIMFVDSDDWIDFDTCEKVLNAMLLSDADITMWSYVSEREGKQIHKDIFSEEIIFDEQLTRKFLHRRFVGIIGNELSHPELADSLCPVWGKMYKANLIKEHGVVFTNLSEIGTYEDGLFNLELFFYARKVLYLKKNFYHYRRDNDKSITSKHNKRLFEQWQTLFNKIECYINENHLSQEYMEALNNRIALSILGLGLNVLSEESELWEKLKKIKYILEEERYVNAYKKLELKYLPLHWKLFYYSARKKWSLAVYCMLYVIRKIISR